MNRGSAYAKATDVTSYADNTEMNREGRFSMRPSDE